MSRVAIIPARGGSRRIPRKNIRPFWGKPIIAYAIETAKETGLFDAIYVSSEDAEILEVARVHGAAGLRRPIGIAQDYVGTQEVTAAALEDMREMRYACCIYPTTPLMSAENIRDGWAALHLRDAFFSMSVGTEPLADAGQFYWGHSWAFRDRVPLVDTYTAMVPVESKRVCDINTEEDWARAERMYGELNRDTILDRARRMGGEAR